MHQQSRVKSRMWPKKSLLPGCLVTLLLASNLRGSEGWSWTGDTIDVDNSLLNMDLFSEGSGDGNIVETKQTSSNGPPLHTDTNSVALNTGKPILVDDWTPNAEKDRRQWLKGEKGEPGARGEKGDCVKEYITEQLPTCGCNVSLLMQDYGDILRGLKGDIGPRGPIGPSGIPGPPGPPGHHGREISFETGGNLIDPSLTYMGARISEPGPPGPRGLPGHKGETGSPGFGIKGDPGERGKRGKTGKTGPKGPPGPIGLQGPKGADVRISDLKQLMMENGIKGVKGEQGIQGLPGPPGPPAPMPYDSWSDNSLSSRSRHFRGKMYDRISGGDTGMSVSGYLDYSAQFEVSTLALVYIEGPPGPQGPKGEPGTKTVGSASLAFIAKDIEQLQHSTLSQAEGTLAFVLSEQSLLVRNKNGWQYLMLGDSLTLPQGVTLEKTNEGTSVQPSAAMMGVEATESNRHIGHNKKLRMAALNHPFTGDMHGVRGADYECFRQSRRANLKGTFRALIASRTQNLDSIVRLKDAKLPVVNLRDEILFNSWRDLFTGAGAPFPYPPKIYSFDGRNIFTDPTWSQKLVWHGADRSGVRNTEAYCDAWASNAMSRMGVASNLLRGKLLDQEKYSCNNSFIVLCVEVTSEESSSRHRRQSVHNSE